MPRKTHSESSFISRSVRFNEAAARCRGKRGARSEPEGSTGGFNEAAARCRGKQGGAEMMGWTFEAGLQ